MKVGSRQTVLSAAVLAALAALPVAPVALAQEGLMLEEVVVLRKGSSALKNLTPNKSKQPQHMKRVKP